jgi:hypothetical protein
MAGVLLQPGRAICYHRGPACSFAACFLGGHVVPQDLCLASLYLVNGGSGNEEIVHCFDGYMDCLFGGSA